MTEHSNYWTRRFNRRSALRGAGLTATGLLGVALIGCGDDDDGAPVAPAATQAAAATATQAAAATATQAAAGTATQAAAATATEAAATATEAAAGSDRPRGGEMISIHAGIRTGDIHRASGPSEQRLANISQDGLLQDLEPTPGEFITSPMLAESFERPDNLTLTFKIRDGVKFHNVAPVNGRVLTAEDVKFSFERQASDEPGFPHASFFDQVESIEAVSDSELTIVTSKPSASILTSITSPWSTVIAREQVDQDQGELKSFIGTGPFIQKRLEANIENEFERNPDYWEEGKPYLDTWRNLEISSDAHVAAFQGGQITNIYEVEQGGDVAVALRGSDDDANVIERTDAGISLIGFNTLVPPYDDPRVRRAVAWGADVKGWLSVLNAGYGQLTGPMAAGFKLWALPEDQLVYTSPNPAESMKLLAAAGIDSLRMRVTGFPGAQSEGMAVQLQSDLRPLGIDVDVDVTASGGEYVQRVFVQADYDVVAGQDFARHEPDHLRPRFQSGSGANFFKYANAELDVLWEKQSITLDYEERRGVVDEIQRLILEEVPAFYVYHQTVFSVFHKMYSDMRVSAITGNAHRWNSRNAFVSG